MDISLSHMWIDYLCYFPLSVYAMIMGNSYRVYNRYQLNLIAREHPQTPVTVLYERYSVCVHPLKHMQQQYHYVCQMTQRITHKLL